MPEYLWVATNHKWHLVLKSQQHMSLDHNGAPQRITTGSTLCGRWSTWPEAIWARWCMIVLDQEKQCRTCCKLAERRDAKL